MFTSVPYATSRGDPKTQTDADVYLYGLSFCEHCREGQKLLEESGIRFSMTYLDQLEPDVRRPILRSFREIYGERVIYPVLEINGQFTFGYDRESWSNLLASISHRE